MIQKHYAVFSVLFACFVIFKWHNELFGMFANDAIVELNSNITIAQHQQQKGSNSHIPSTKTLNKSQVNQPIPKQKSGKQTLKYYAQTGQDKWIEPYVKKQNGVYVEFGALDGLIFSNTAYFAFKYNWTGVLVEPDGRYSGKLQINRPDAKVFTGVVVCPKGLDKVDFAISKNEGWSGIKSSYNNSRWMETIQQTQNSMDCIDLNVICPDFVDFMSVDTEGSEFSIFKTFDFQKHDVRFIQVEQIVETQGQRNNEQQLTDFMSQKGYDKIIQHDIGNKAVDNVYKKRNQQ